jgi:hypothetical protein
MSDDDKYPCTHCKCTGYIVVFEKLPLENPTLHASDLKGVCRVCRGLGYTFVPNENSCYHEYLTNGFKFIEDYRSLGIIYGYHTATCHKCGQVTKLHSDSRYANFSRRD